MAKHARLVWLGGAVLLGGSVGCRSCSTCGRATDSTHPVAATAAAPVTTNAAPVVAGSPYAAPPVTMAGGTTVSK
jgi:hypothetical protein